MTTWATAKGGRSHRWTNRVRARRGGSGRGPPRRPASSAAARATSSQGAVEQVPGGQEHGGRRRRPPSRSCDTSGQAQQAGGGEGQGGAGEQRPAGLGGGLGHDRGEGEQARSPRPARTAATGPASRTTCPVAPGAVRTSSTTRLPSSATAAQAKATRWSCSGATPTAPAKVTAAIAGRHPPEGDGEQVAEHGPERTAMATTSSAAVKAGHHDPAAGTATTPVQMPTARVRPTSGREARSARPRPTPTRATASTDTGSQWSPMVRRSVATRRAPGTNSHQVRAAPVRRTEPYGRRSVAVGDGPDRARLADQGEHRRGSRGRARPTGGLRRRRRSPANRPRPR